MVAETVTPARLSSTDLETKTNISALSPPSTTKISCSEFASWGLFLGDSGCLSLNLQQVESSLNWHPRDQDARSASATSLCVTSDQLLFSPSLKPSTCRGGWGGGSFSVKWSLSAHFTLWFCDLRGLGQGCSSCPWPESLGLLLP